MTVVRADARCLPLADNSVDLIVTSPPYFALRSYQDGGEHYAGQIGAEPTPAEFVDALITCTREWMRVLKPSGSIWVNLGDKYARNGGGGSGSSDGSTGRGPRPASRGTGAPEKSLIGIPWRYALRCIDDLGLILRAEVIWSKPNGLPESVTDRVRRSHEQWYHFTLSPRYYSAVDQIRQPYEGTPQRRFSPRIKDRRAEGRPVAGWDVRWDTPRAGDNPLGKLPGSVWTIATEPLVVPAQLGVDHFAAFPTEWPHRIVTGWSPPAGTVLDPFGGTGTTALVASVLGRRGVSVDLSHDYCRLARWRTTDPSERARAMRVEKPPKQLDGQTDLFGEAS